MQKKNYLKIATDSILKFNIRNVYIYIYVCTYVCIIYINSFIQFDFKALKAILNNIL